MQRLTGSRLRKKAPLLKGEEVVLRLEIHTNAFGGHNAWLWANVPGEGPVAYTATVRHPWTGLGPDQYDSECLTDDIHWRLRDLLPFILV